MVATKTPTKKPRYSAASWSVGDTPTKRPIPLVPIPRLVRIVETLGEYLDPVFPGEAVALVVSEYDERRDAVSAVAAAMLATVDSRNREKRPALSLDYPNPTGAGAGSQPGLPLAMSLVAERSRLTAAREHFLTEVERARARCAGAPAKCALLRYAHAAITAESLGAGDRDLFRRYVGVKWTEELMYDSLQDWLPDAVKRNTLHQRARRFRHEFKDDPVLMTALAEYLTALAEAQDPAVPAAPSPRRRIE